MNAIKRHALGLGIVLFAAAAFLAMAPVSSGGYDCGSAIWRTSPDLATVEVLSPEGQVLLLPDPEQADAKDQCVNDRHVRTMLSGSFAIAGLVGVFWSVVASPATGRRRSAQHRLA